MKIYNKLIPVQKYFREPQKQEVMYNFQTRFATYLALQTDKLPF